MPSTESHPCLSTAEPPLETGGLETGVLELLAPAVVELLWTAELLCGVCAVLCGVCGVTLVEPPVPSAFGGTISLYELCVRIGPLLDELVELVELVVLAELVELVELTELELSSPRKTSSFFAHPASITTASAAAVDFNNLKNLLVFIILSRYRK